MEPVLQPAQGNQPCKCKGGNASRSTRQTIDAKVTFSNGKWAIEPDPIRLEHPDDTVIWSLVHLMVAYPEATKFEIRFSDWPGTLKPVRGPFANLTDGTMLMGDGIVSERGCYTYNIWVTVPGRNTHDNVFPIDPQIDNVAPPGINPLGPDEVGSHKELGVKEEHRP
jgi:hypothetical protein